MTYTATNLKARLEKEIPILKGNYATLSDNPTNYYSLPLTIHNICLCVGERAYMFIRPTIDLYTLMSNDLQGTDKEEVTKRLEFLRKLEKDEDNLYSDQLTSAMADIEQEIKDNKEEVPTIDERIEYFQHIELNLYEFIYPFFYLVKNGTIALTEDYTAILNELVKLSLGILKEFIPKRETALQTCNTVLRNDKH